MAEDMVMTPTAVVDMLDTIGASAGNVPLSTRRVGVYVTGPSWLIWTNKQIAEFSAAGAQTVVRIDQANSILNFPFYVVKDIEHGASSLPVAIEEARQRGVNGLRTGFYFSRADEQAVRAAVSAAGLDAHIDYCLADWNLTRTEAVQLIETGRYVWVQYASPSSNPHTLVPGSNRTLRQANVDLGVTRADWPAVLAPVPTPVPTPKPPTKKPHPKVVASTAAVALVGILEAVLPQLGVSLKVPTADVAVIAAVLSGLAGYFTPSPSPKPATLEK